MTSVVKIDIKDEGSESTFNKTSYKVKEDSEENSAVDYTVWDKITRLVMITLCITHIYISINYTIPALFADYDNWTHYYLKLLIWFIWIEGVANYFCTRLYDSSYVKSRDRPNLFALNDRWNNPPEHFVPYDFALSQQNGHAVNIANDQRDDGGIPWRYCEKSQMYIPPRSHFCKVCKKCILKRDHHCFIVGTCVGFYNQRYFVVLMFYVVLGALVGCFWTSSYLINIYWPDAVSWTDFFLPVTVVRILSGVIPIHIGIMVYHVHVMLFYGVFAFLFFSSQISLISKGRTSFEISQNVYLKCKNSVNSNFVSVFGNFWLLNFLFPMVLIFKQPGDGTVWDGIKLDHNANSERNVTD